MRIVEPKPALKPFDVGIAVQKKRLEEPLIRAFWDTARGLGTVHAEPATGRCQMCQYESRAEEERLAATSSHHQGDRA